MWESNRFGMVLGPGGFCELNEIMLQNVEWDRRFLLCAAKLSGILTKRLKGFEGGAVLSDSAGEAMKSLEDAAQV